MIAHKAIGYNMNIWLNCLISWNHILVSTYVASIIFCFEHFTKSYCDFAVTIFNFFHTVDMHVVKF